jgi:hypothetical protein
LTEFFEIICIDRADNRAFKCQNHERSSLFLSNRDNLNNQIDSTTPTVEFKSELPVRLVGLEQLAVLIEKSSINKSDDH